MALLDRVTKMGILKAISIITGAQGDPGTPGTNGANGAPGIVPMYGSGGLMSSPKAFVGQATTNSSGLWSISFATAGFTAPPNVQSQAISSDNTIANATGCTVTGITATGCNGVAFKTQVSVLGLLPIVPVAAGTVINIMAVGI